MGREKVRQRLRENGEQGSVESAADVKTIGPHQTEQHDKVEESSPETPESPRKLMSEPGELPESYGETRVVLLPVEPYLLHVYWEVTSVELEKAKDQLGDEYGRSQAILRCYDVTDIIFEGTNAHGSFDVPVDLSAKSRYVDLWSPEKSYFVELGFETEDGRFFPIARSNIAEVPPAWPAPKADEHYMLVAGDYDLLEAVPAPIDVQPSYGLTPSIGSRAEPELPSAAKKDRHFEMRSPFSGEEDFSKSKVLEEPFGNGIEAGEANVTAEMRKPEPVPESLGSTEQFSKEKERPSHKIAERFCDFDLTEMSEKRFTFGLSSS